MNYDTGAEATVFPVEMAGDIENLKEKGAPFVVASGADIPNYGKVKLPGMDERYNSRTISGNVTEVHKPLVSAGQVSKSHDGFIWEDGGALVPRQSALAVGMRKEWYRLVRKHGLDSQQVLPLRREGGTYNFYVKKSGKMEQINPLGEGQPPPPPPLEGSSGNHRRAQKKT